ncbi:LysR family transcriptional regulator [Vreelandella titanicae]|uniref:HTH-type transcriptional regulator CynR n=1 Tax=Vreelandella titanicae TaxID=664683 RepID=A0A1G8T324_9GAMM|nr:MULTISPECIES: LysR family transcriptional regulator [Halomonas]UEQ03798.1 LysR family transcriptional regulator [Halomonas profundus]QKS25827.1 HTH-type transcriptional regulator CynR [Halomonas titanicae]QNU64047.1 LysR family transcriptional regulator [Halomonas titanicae]CDG52975.1 LysR family transcriptional regulator [Halomonas sp. A3H3]SDJ35876.1 DNA-binding transcriptional regulator, LysR family [Halomonas titanicae]
MDILDKRAFYLLEVNSCGGIRAAAEHLHINPSVVSRQVRGLERDLGMALLERQGRHVMLTEAGQLVVDSFLAQRRLNSELGDTLSRLRNMQAGKVVVSVGDGFVDSFINYVMRRVSKQYPDVLIEIKTGIYYPREPHEMVANDEVDIAITYGPVSDPRLIVHSFERGPLCALVALFHPLASQESVSVAELLKHKLIFLPDVSGSQQFVNSLFSAAGQPATPSYRCNLHSVSRRMASAGVGVSFMTAAAARNEIESGLLKAVPIQHPMAASSQGNLVRRVGRRLSPAADYLWKLMLTMQ